MFERTIPNQYTTDSPADVVPPAVPEPPCCMCNCKGTLQAILREMRAMRRLMQTQKGQWINTNILMLWEIEKENIIIWYCLFLASLERQELAASPCQPCLGSGLSPRCRPRKRRSIYKVAPFTVSSSRKAALAPLETSPLLAAPAESEKREECEKEQDSSTPNSHSVSSGVSVLPPQSNPVTVTNTHNPLLNQPREPQSSEVMHSN